MTANPTLALGGEMNIVDAAALCQQLSQLLATSTGDITLDLAEVESCDSAGVQLLLALRRSLAERQAALHIVQVAEPVRQALATLGLAELLGGPTGVSA
jgi:phospholipid transport system transporter-binding protein